MKSLVGFSRRAALLAVVTLVSSVGTVHADDYARIALLADVHTDLSGKGNSVTYLPHFQAVIAQVLAAHVDLVLIAGDLANHPRESEWKDFQRRIQAFPVPVLYVPGNHDILNKFNSGKASVVTSAAYERYVRALGPGFFVREAAGFRIIGLAGSLFGSGLPEEDAQWRMLEQAADQPSAFPTLVFCHYPLFVKSLNEAGGVYWNIEIAPRQRLLGFLRRCHAIAYLSGHLHRPLDAKAAGIPFIGAPAIAFGLPLGRQPEGWTLVEVPRDGRGEVRSEIHYVPH